MGCESSRSVEVENTITKSSDLQDLREQLTELQVDVIRSTWPILRQNMVDVGVRLMKDVFSTEPAVQDMFPVRGLSSDQLDDSERLRAHALSYMKVFALVADALEDQAGDAAVNEYLLMLGAKHSSFKGFDPIYFITFRECTHNAWEWTLGEEYIEDVRDAWNLIFDFIVDKLTFAHKCYVAEGENELAATQTDLSQK